MKHVDPVKPTSFLDHVYLDALSANVNRTKVSLKNTENCSNLESLQEQLNSYLNRRKMAHTVIRSFTTRKDTRRNVLKYIANW